MRRELFLAPLLTTTLLLMAGCTSPAHSTGGAATQQPPSSPTNPAAKAPGPVSQARDLFPAADTELKYIFQDRTRTHEWLVVDGDRLIQTVDDQPYATWLFTANGVYRPDSGDPQHKALLRYLPAQLQDGLSWTQLSPRYVQFQLKHLPHCSGDGITADDCWQLRVLEWGSSLTTFDFAPGLGVIHATAQARVVKDAFDKQLQKAAPASLAPEQRRNLLQHSPTLAQMQLPDPGQIQAQPDFAAEAARFTQIPPCGGSGSGQPILPGASGRLTLLCGQQLWSMDLATGSQTPLYTSPTTVDSFAWHPKGTGIAYSTGPHHDIWYWDATTKTTRRAWGNDADGAYPEWSASGNILVANQGTSPVRAFVFLDPATGRKLGSSNGYRLLWSQVSDRYAVENPVRIPNEPTSGGSSGDVVVGDIHSGGFSERTIAKGDEHAGYTPVYFAADGTLVYEQFVPTQRDQNAVAFWAMPPGDNVQPSKLAATSPSVVEAQKRLHAREAVIAREKASLLDLSPDGKWQLLLYTSYDEIYLIRSDLTGPAVRVPGTDHVWDPRKP